MDAVESFYYYNKILALTSFRKKYNCKKTIQRCGYQTNLRVRRYNYITVEI